MFQTKSSSLEDDQIGLLNQKVGGTHTVVTAAVVKIHSKEKDVFNFTYTGLFGALCVIVDRKTHLTYTKLYSLPGCECQFEMEINCTFKNKINKMNDCFLYFFHKNSIIGLSFAESEDTTTFERAVERYTKSFSKNRFTLRKTKMFSRPMIFELKENIGWNHQKLIPDFTCCSKQFHEHASSQKIVFQSSDRRELLLETTESQIK